MKKILLSICALFLIFSMSSCTSKTEMKKVDELINEIEKLPEVITLDMEEKVTTLINNYNNIDVKYQPKVTNYEKLVKAKSTIDSLKEEDRNNKEASLAVDAEIESLLPLTNLTLDDEQKVKNVMKKYEELNSAAKQYVTKYDDLLKAQEKIEELKSELERDQAIAASVDDLITDLPNPSDLTLDDEGKVVAARTAYDDLTSNQQKYVRFLDDLIAAEEQIEKLKKIEQQKAQAKKVDDAILALPAYASVTLNDEEKINKVRAMYDALTSEEQAYVTKLANLIALESKINKLKHPTSDNILDMVSDVVSSDVIDTLPSNIDGISYKWSSSNPNLYIIKDGMGYASKVNQTHKKQIVTVSVEITYQDGYTDTLSKTIVINPIKFTNMPSTPVATYFSTGAMYAYKRYNTRYLKDGTIFSSTTKDILDIVYYAFITINADGTCQIADTSYLDEVRKLRENNVRIIASINGVSSESCKNFRNITADANLRKKFVNNLMDLVEKYNLDGLDIDWETVSESLKVVASSMNALSKELREEMTLRQEEGGTPYYLTAAVPASSYGTASDRFDFKTLNSYLDYINIMSYDLNKTNYTSHLSPLYSSSYDNGYHFSCDYGITRISSLGFDRSKLIIGSAGYGKAYKVSGSSSSSYVGLGALGSLISISGVDGSFNSGTLYGNAIKALIDSGKYTKYDEYNTSGKFVGSYLYNATDKIFVTYDSEEAIKLKYEYANSMSGVGIMCWCYSEDTSDNFVDAIYKAKLEK